MKKKPRQATADSVKSRGPSSLGRGQLLKSGAMFTLNEWLHKPDGELRCPPHPGAGFTVGASTVASLHRSTEPHRHLGNCIHKRPTRVILVEFFGIGLHTCSADLLPLASVALVTQGKTQRLLLNTQRQISRDAWRQ